MNVSSIVQIEHKKTQKIIIKSKNKKRFLIKQLLYLLKDDNNNINAKLYNN